MNRFRSAIFLTLASAAALIGCGKSEALQGEQKVKNEAAHGATALAAKGFTDEEGRIVTPAETPNTSPLTSCTELEQRGPSKDVLIDDFLAAYPHDIFNPAKVEAFALTPAELDDVVANLACAAGLSGYGPDVAESALALFASKRYGNPAMAALRRHSDGDDVKARSARTFAGQMVDYLKEPTE
jgi:hypothetical protein